MAAARDDALMDAGRWDAVKAMLHEALERPSEDRDAYLDAACAGDAALRAELASLVAAHDDDFLEVPAFAAAADALERGRRDDLAGGRVGPFRVVREIGRGGMGTVYLADRADGTYERRVALKVISRGMDTDLVVRRFRRERQILAGLDHPDIARLFSGGTTDDGRPYLVMEYVEGEPIDVYCARHALGIPERLALFRRVCGAVQYAHQRLVVHRDLKPGNILVAPDGAPKLLDFGIAKVLRPAGERTEATRRATTLHAMTPEYASPEQRAGEPVTTLSDVYSLGVLLHELLTGRHPGVDGPSGADPERPSVVVTRPPNGSLAPPGDPSTLRRALRGDLDTIVLKAMRHEPARRYASAEQLADDVRRHAERLPVLARPDTFRYRSGRFVRRHRAAVAAACLTTLSLLGAAGATARQASVARAAQGQAERRFAEVRELATSFLFELDSAMAPLPGTMATRELIVRRALRSLDGLAREAHDDPSLLRDLAEAYRKVGDVQGAPYIANLGHTADALASYRKSAAILERLARTTPGTAPNGRRARERLSSTYAAMSAVQARAGDVDGAVRAGRRAVALCDTLLRADPTNPRYRRLLAEALLFLGRATFLRHSEPTTYEALADYERALAMRDTMLAAAPLDPRARGAAAIMRAYASYAHWRLAELTADTSHYRAALVLLSSAHDLFALNARLRPDDLHARRDAVVPLREIA
ncbi:MAG: protein kinase, partial [Gemmatirosa sp.]|nr:protein kinase [Gemmatirosa sp.]